MNNQFKTICEDSTAISIIGDPRNIFKHDELISLATQSFKQGGLDHCNQSLKAQNRGNIPILRDNWINHGMECEILEPNSEGWKKGKVRFKISLEFCPEEVTSSDLDLLR